MLAVIFSMNFQWPNNLTHAFESAIGPIVFFNFIGAWMCAWLYAWLCEWLYAWLISTSEQRMHCASVFLIDPALFFPRCMGVLYTHSTGMLSECQYRW
jgi:hypothetical protein